MKDIVSKIFCTRFYFEWAALYSMIMAAQDVKFKHACLKIIETDFVRSLRGKSDDRHVHRYKLIWNPVWAVQMMISTNLKIQSKSYFIMKSSLFIWLCLRWFFISLRKIWSQDNLCKGNVQNFENKYFSSFVPSIWTKCVLLQSVPSTQSNNLTKPFKIHIPPSAFVSFVV